MNKNQSGIALVYAILVLAIVSLIGLGASLLIVREIKLVSVSHYSTQAFYAAESGIERGLFTVKTNRLIQGETLGNTVTTIASYNNADFKNNASYDNAGTAKGGTNNMLGTVEKDDILQLDLYDPDNPLNPAPEKKYKQIDVTASGGSGSEWLEVSWFGWYLNGGVFTLQNADKKVYSHTELLNIPRVVLDDPLDVINMLGFRVRFRALYDKVENLQVTAYDDATPVPNTLTLPETQIVIKSTGTKGDVQQAILATVPWRLPLLGIYDYVLFSEQKLSKTLTTGQPVYTSGAINVEKNLTASCNDCSLCTNPPWLATPCLNSNCTVTGEPSPYCTVLTNGALFTLPIPDYIPAGSQYYISMRVNYTGSVGDERLTITVNDLDFGAQARTLIDQGTAPKSCTMDSPVQLSNKTGRTITFTNASSSIPPLAVQIDWYQLSSYQIFTPCT